MKAPKCADCGSTFPHITHVFAITPPSGREEGGGRTFFLCATCWDRMIGLAVMQSYR